MAPQTRVRVNDAKRISELATVRGLEHYIYDDGDWTRFEFTNIRGKRAFENLCSENNITVDGQQSIDAMLDAVIKGRHPSKVISEQLSNGMKKAMKKDAKFVCDDCELYVPKYTGRYPATCPECGGKLTAVDLENEKEADEE